MQLHLANQSVKVYTLYVDGHKSVGDADHIKAFTSRAAADKWFRENDPEGVAFEYEVMDDARG